MIQYDPTLPIDDIPYVHEIAVRLKLECIADHTLESSCDCPETVLSFIRRTVQPLAEENILLFLLDSRLKIISFCICARGSLDQCICNAREIFKAAILSCAHSVILVHNHPSCDVRPSTKDYDACSKLIRAGVFLDMPVLDSIIIGPTGKSYSMLVDDKEWYQKTVRKAREEIKSFYEK